MDGRFNRSREAQASERPAIQTVCEVPACHGADRPLSPWLRLAHRRRKTFGPSEVPLRRLTDFELLLTLDGESWLWIEPAEGALRLRKNSLALIPPGLVQTWGEPADAPRSGAHN